MPPREAATKQKRSRKKKSRTADPISSSDSSSSSSAGSDSESSQPPAKKVASKDSKTSKKRSKTKRAKSTISKAASASPTPDTDIPAAAREEMQSARLPSSAAAEEAFTSYYLRQITTNFSEDLDKIRSASDFKTSSLPMLIEALRQGRSCFGTEERIGVGRAVLAKQAVED